MSMTDKRYIKFERCPIEPHKGERWEKLEKVDTSKPVVLVDSFLCCSTSFWSRDGLLLGGLDVGIIPTDGPTDTFMDFTFHDWCNLMKCYYGVGRVSGLALLFKQGDYLFTTFRAYTVEKHKFYKENRGKEFWVKED